MKLCVYVKDTQFIKCTEKLFAILFLGDEIDLYRFGGFFFYFTLLINSLNLIFKTLRNFNSLIPLYI